MCSARRASVSVYVCVIILVGNEWKKCVDDNNEQNETNRNAPRERETVAHSIESTKSTSAHVTQRKHHQQQPTTNNQLLNLAWQNLDRLLNSLRDIIMFQCRSPAFVVLLLLYLQ